MEIKSLLESLSQELRLPPTLLLSLSPRDAQIAFLLLVIAVLSVSVSSQYRAGKRLEKGLAPSSKRMAASQPGQQKLAQTYGDSVSVLDEFLKLKK